MSRDIVIKCPIPETADRIGERDSPSHKRGGIPFVYYTKEDWEQNKKAVEEIKKFGEP